MQLMLQWGGGVADLLLKTVTRGTDTYIIAVAKSGRQGENTLYVENKKLGDMT